MKLYKAIEGNEKDKAISLIKEGVDIHLTNRDNLTPLHLAAMYGQYEIASALIRYDADIEAQGTGGMPPNMCYI